MGHGSAAQHRSNLIGLSFALVAACCFVAVQAHVHLLFPPPNSPFDGLDNIRTTDVCGHVRSGYLDSYHFRNFAPLDVGTAKLQAGSTLNVSWTLPVPHMGGWKLDLYHPSGPGGELQQVYGWDNASHWGCSADGTQTWAEIELPSAPCQNCTLRLARQKREDVYGVNYYYFSCAAVDISAAANNSSAAETGACQGCNNHGKCVQGKCQCDYSADKGYWSGQYCQVENECDSSDDCGSYGLCREIPSYHRPKRECWCQKGYFGDVDVTPGSGVRRVCNRPTSLTLNDTASWDKVYKKNIQSSPNNTYNVSWLVDSEAGQIEFAVSAKTRNWVGLGYRAVLNARTPADRIPDPAKKPPANFKNLTKPGSCGAAFPEYPDSAVNLNNSKEPWRLDKGSGVPPGNVIQLSFMRRLQQAATPGRWFTTEPLLNTSFGSGMCANYLVNIAGNNSFPMVSQDITIAQVIAVKNKSYFRVMDYFALGKGTPRPYHYYGGKDDILDAVAEETDDGVTRFKFRRPLESNDSRDYCILPDINYQMIYAYGQDVAKPTHAPPSSLELGTASIPDQFYKDDVIAYHGGGTSYGANDTTSYGYDIIFEGRGTLSSSVDFFQAGTSESQCQRSSLQGYECMFHVMEGEYTLHFNATETELHLAAESSGTGWVGLGWSARPREMIGSIAVIGWAGTGGNSNKVDTYELKDKKPQQIVPSQEIAVINASVMEKSQHTILSFTRLFDSTFQRDKQYEMVASYHISEKHLIKHTNRAPFSINFARPDSAVTQSPDSAGTQSLNRGLVKAHGALMFTAFGVLLPAGILLARYFKDIGRNWYLFHATVQLTGLCVALAGFLIAVTQFHSPKDITHFRLGVAVMAGALLQPFTSIPRLSMHHDFYMRGYMWLALHWTLGRAVVLFGWVNIFLGFARYRYIIHHMPHWPEFAFGIYLGWLFLLALVLETRLARKEMQKRRAREDALEKQVADLKKQVKQEGADDSDEEELLGGPARPPGSPAGPNLAQASSVSDRLRAVAEAPYRMASFGSTSELSPVHSPDPPHSPGPPHSPDPPRSPTAQQPKAGTPTTGDSSNADHTPSAQT